MVMAKSTPRLKICPLGHQYYKSSDCPTCPECEEARAPKDEFMALLSAPARRALQSASVNTLQDLSKLSESEVLSLHGMGPASIPTLRQALTGHGLTFRRD